MVEVILWSLVAVVGTVLMLLAIFGAVVVWIFWGESKRMVPRDRRRL